MKKGTKVSLSPSSAYYGAGGNPDSSNIKGIVTDIRESGEVHVLWENNMKNTYFAEDLIAEVTVINTDGFMWLHSKGKFVYDDASLPDTLEVLPPGIYTPMLNPMTGDIDGLKLVKNEFDFDYKVYDLDKAFIDRVERTYHHVKGNLGILLNGVKGTGKSVTAKMIANRLNTPVILIDKKPGNLGEFLNNFKQDVTVLIDEFEKVYDTSKNPANQDALLTVMDGMYNNEFTKVFLLTTNSKSINANLTDRPTRLRYIKEYGNLSIEAITEIVEDLLEVPELKKETIKFLSRLELITVDIVKNIIIEVNIHKEDPELFESIFNVTIKKPTVTLEFLNDEGKIVSKQTVVSYRINRPYDVVFDKPNADYYNVVQGVDEPVYHVYNLPRMSYIGMPNKEGICNYYSADEDDSFNTRVVKKGRVQFDVSEGVNMIFASIVEESEDFAKAFIL